MKDVEVKVIHLNGNSSPLELIAAIREQVGDIPHGAMTELLDKLNAFREQGSEHKQAVSAAKERGFDMHAEAERIAKLPKEQQADALREATIKLGESCGLTREQALKRASEANNRVTDLLDKLGLEVPEHYKSNIFKESEKSDPLADAFDDGLKKLSLAGYGLDVAARIGWWLNNQDEYVELMGNVAKLALSNHRPSAKLVVELQQYAANFNKYVYGVCEKAGVDPTVFGFKPKAEQERDAAELDEAMQSIRDIAE